MLIAYLPPTEIAAESRAAERASVSKCLIVSLSHISLTLAVALGASPGHSSGLFTTSERGRRASYSFTNYNVIIEVEDIPCLKSHCRNVLTLFYLKIVKLHGENFFKSRNNNAHNL